MGETSQSETGTNGSPRGHAVEATPPGRGKTEGGGARWRAGRSLILGALGVGVGLLIVGKVVPWISEAMNHVETDDAFVVGRPTTLASRVTDLVEKVLVDDNDYVEKGTLLVQLDREPLQVQVEQKQAELKHEILGVRQLAKAVETDRASLDDARLRVGMALAGLEEASKAVQGMQEQVRFRIASLRASIASMGARKAEVALARKEHDRVQNLVARQSATQAELDQRLASLVSAVETYKAAEQQVQQARAQLNLAPDFKNPERFPEDLERTDTQVRRTVATGQQILAQLGVDFGKNLDPMTFHSFVRSLISRRDASWIDQVPSVRTARAKLEQSIAALGGPGFDASRPELHPSVAKVQKELDEARLKLGYTEIRAPVAGFVNRRSIHPGDHVQTGQALMSIQPLEDVYIVANFKETQLSDLRIGQPVEIQVDAYAGHKVEGRVSGFAPATGSASSLLPPENATGNFVKVVQRVPVRIDLAAPNPVDQPLLVGMSVIPAVRFKDTPSGPDAGRRLRTAKGNGTSSPPAPALAEAH